MEREGDGMKKEGWCVMDIFGGGDAPGKGHTGTYFSPLRALTLMNIIIKNVYFDSISFLI